MCLSMEIIPVFKNVIPPLGYVWKFPLLFQSYMSNGDNSMLNQENVECSF